MGLGALQVPGVDIDEGDDATLLVSRGFAFRRRSDEDKADERSRPAFDSRRGA